MSDDEHTRASQGKQAPTQSKRLRRAVVLVALILFSAVFVGMFWTIAVLEKKIQNYEATTIIGNAGNIDVAITNLDRGQLNTFLADCEKGLNGRTLVQPDYSKDLNIDLNQTRSYAARLDIRDITLPVGIPIRRVNPQNPPVEVQCVVSARLVPVDKYLSVKSNDEVQDDSDNDWIMKQFTGSGVVDWSWTVTALKPGDRQLQLYLQPAVATQQLYNGNIIYLAQSNSSLDTTSRSTSVHVHANRFQLAGQWVSDNVPTIKTVALSIVSTLAAVVIGVLVAAGKVGKAWRDAWTQWRSPRK